MILYNGVRFPLDFPCPANVRRLDMGALPMIEAMNANGILLDTGKLASISRQLSLEEARLEVEIEQAVGYRLNPESGDQVARLLFDELQLPPSKMTKKQLRFSVDDDVLSSLLAHHPVVKLIADHREADKLRTTYADALPLLVNADGRIRTTLKATTARTGRLASENPNCFDAETEILTESGWIPFPQLLDGVKVAQWRKGVISFVLPLQKIETQCEVLRIYNQHIDLCVTPNHRCLLVDRKTLRPLVTYAANYPEDKRQLNAGLWGGGRGLELSDDMLRLLVAVQADGSWSSAGIGFKFRKVRKIERLRSLLLSVGAPFTESTGKNRTTSFYMKKSPVVALVRSFVGSLRLFRAEWLFRMSRAQANVFLAEIHFWDGCWTRKNHYASRHKQNADAVQALFVLSGRRANVRKYVNSHGSVSWQVDVTLRDYSMTTNIQRETLGVRSVYCVSVPSGFVVVRRHGKVMVTGNCQNIPTRGVWGPEIRKAFVARPGWRLVSCDLSQIEMRVAAHCSEDPYLVLVFVDGLDIHTFTAINQFKLDEKHILSLLASDKAGTLTEEQAAALKQFKQQYRLPAKTLSFAVLYGVTAAGLQIQILAAGGPLIPLEECQLYIDGWFDLYEEVRVWQEMQYQRARLHGMVWDFFGRYRLVPEVRSALRGVQNEGLRKAGNHWDQAGAGGILRLAMAKVWYDVLPRYGEDVLAILQIHDELLFEAKQEVAEDLAQDVRQVMSSVVPLLVPVDASSDVAETWGDLK